MNAVWLLYYITDDAVRRQRGEFRDGGGWVEGGVVGTDYIGPMAKPRSRR